MGNCRRMNLDSVGTWGPSFTWDCAWWLTVHSYHPIPKNPHYRTNAFYDGIFKKKNIRQLKTTNQINIRLRYRKITKTLSQFNLLKSFDQAVG